jgi:arginyl-tRNA synthetase
MSVRQQTDGRWTYWCADCATHVLTAQRRGWATARNAEVAGSEHRVSQAHLDHIRAKGHQRLDGDHFEALLERAVSFDE